MIFSGPKVISNNLNESRIPIFPGTLRKNDALFLYGAAQHEKPFVLTYDQDTCEIVHGPSCNVKKEIEVNSCIEDGVPVIERRGGGGTVVLSKGMCITIAVGHRADRNALPIFNAIHSGMISLLEANGINGLQQQGISDITIDNKKILGSSLYLGTNPPLFYYQSCLMVCSDISLLGRYLKHPPREPQYRNNRVHSAFCTTLHQAGYNMPTEMISSIFRDHLDKLFV